MTPYEEIISKISDMILMNNYQSYISIEDTLLDAMDKFPDRIELPIKLLVVWKKLQNYSNAAAGIQIIDEGLLQFAETDISTYYPFVLFYQKVIEYHTTGKVNIPYFKKETFILAQLITDYYMSLPFEEIPEDLIDPLKYVISPSFHLNYHFPYPDIIRAGAVDMDIYVDKNNNLPYVRINDKRLYYPIHDSENLKLHLSYYLMEQHSDSPHCYLSDTFHVSQDDVILDVGAAEANFTLENIELCKKAYVFEPEPEWPEALECTFRPWLDKVELIRKFAGDHSDENTTTIDEVTGGNPVNFIKMDIEGAELSALRGAEKTIQNSPNLKIAICTYHNKEDADILSEYLTEHGFSIEFSKGYMLFFTDTFEPPFFRKGLIRAVKL